MERRLGYREKNPDTELSVSKETGTICMELSDKHCL